ncbi:bifunctional UDP-N-acetylglucosamine diphosphorylase/glucosamine-1-phosphate N-acetyltransferase GlmU [Sinimarinibacterium sp. NLF-5-8]|uniref:bifunctional UDP-N-acetylglucosamine diphosphorylase/glucosamine-1-phosphate N-acetyltransferase GlmU n=1 Tax=Sinimarinibacterium sp. NLF-5-8 TaxID=2698684 RepID=UPI00137C0408|nr:bifunctional UDP-N-acetylglucosamine diphosphorylase/glucosamine-1-phosphate N-acetyltransferase GlmU [Sinimarinibacterium sp. NLF-5-8]QHS10388.1 UDP-N-acetylglucosamine diphosphorylase/glucosamine-1-phosphate N-acetyltransferase [Sinimarinibacterium sp. NLF-5-8]
MNALHCVVLAAGQGTRMKSALPKVLQPIGGQPMLAHVIDTARALLATTHVVYGHGGEQVQAFFAEQTQLHWAHQAEQKGTAHAVQQAMPQIPDDATVLILYGDVPLIRAATLQSLLAQVGGGLAVLTVQLSNPTGYGRIVRNAGRQVQGIVEEKDANAAQKAITEVNTGVMAASAQRLRAWLSRIGNANANGEFYLTDVVALAVADGVTVNTVSASSAEEVEGANDRIQLARLERAYQRREVENLMHQGVRMADPARVDIRGRVMAGRDVFLDVGCILEGEVTLGDNVHIGAYSMVRDSEIGADTQIEAHSILDRARVGKACQIGPFARLRPQAQIGDEAHVGNFVEIKKTTLGARSKANHLAYLGDGEVGSDVNIGAGTIFCNYDGANKHLTVIEDGAFIGSDSQLVAPVRVGRGATVGAGSTIAKDVPAGGLTICRAREQKTFANWQRPRKTPKA